MLYFEQMSSGGGSYSGSRPRRQRITSQQAIPIHSALKGSVAAVSTVGSTTSVAGPISSQAWGRGHGRRGPSRGVTDRRLESGKRWNVKVINGTGIGESGAQFGFSPSYASLSFPGKALHLKVLPLGSQRFLQLTERANSSSFQSGISLVNSRAVKRCICAESGKQTWDLGRFLRTLYFFSGPPSPAKFIEYLIAKFSSGTSTEPEKKMTTSDVILVTRATGGVGRRVVDILRQRGYLVRALVVGEYGSSNGDSDDLETHLADN
ncbi:hypothetical protein Taro_053073 [Colocasia esculenta]|uniref:Uncharacterized protein n=1 Tax=Colocasia esculenta TaxID=4460 RepID=A0A843XK88_COLES|nr:hypothetical protein [Colocasia esculenta]